MLSALGLTKPPAHWLVGLYDEDSEMVRFCMLSAPDSRVLADHSLEDELRTLQLGESKDVMETILNTRFSDLEQSSLEALLLDGYGAI